jgi:hypothetical protein
MAQRRDMGCDQDRTTAFAGSLGLSERLFKRETDPDRSRTVYSKEADDLRQEAVIRTLDGRRNWSPHVDFETHLKGAMRSIAHEWMEVSNNALKAANHRHNGDIAADRRDPSREQAYSIIRRTILQLQGDSEALSVLDAMLDGKRPMDIRRLLAMDSKVYNAARRRVRRCAQKASAATMMACRHDNFSRRTSQNAPASALGFQKDVSLVPPAG